MQPNFNDSNMNYDAERELLKQIETLKGVIHQKTVQLNMVIKTSEEKYSDIHDKYRLMASELHESWRSKYTNLQKENERLLNCLTFILNRQKSQQSQSQQSLQSNSSNSSNSNSNLNDISSDSPPPSVTSNVSNISNFADLFNDQDMFGGSRKSNSADENNQEYVD